MEKLITIVRYSNTAFLSMYQSHHLKLINYHLNEFKTDRFPEHIRKIMFDQHLSLRLSYLKNKKRVKYGIWCFLSGYEYFMELSHIKYIPRLYKARINSNTTVYTKLLDKKLLITDEYCKRSGFFIPEDQLYNITEEWQVGDDKMCCKP